MYLPVSRMDKLPSVYLDVFAYDMCSKVGGKKSDYFAYIIGPRNSSRAL